MTYLQWLGLYVLGSVFSWCGYAIFSDFSAEPGEVAGAAIVWPIALLRTAYRLVKLWRQA